MTKLNKVVEEGNSKISVPFFSICIPVYNVEKYLHECIDSVLKQSEQDFEIILIDDGSKDTSGEICDAYVKKHRNIKVIHKKNEGLFLARIDAINASNGKYLLFLDSDDYYYDGALKILKQIIKKYNADMVIFDWNRVYANGKSIRKTEIYDNMRVFSQKDRIEILSYFVLSNSLNSIALKCVHRKLFSKYFDYKQFIGLNQAEDKLLSLQLFDNANCIVYLKEALYGYRANENSISNNMSLKNYKDVQIVREQVAIYVKKWGLSEKILKKRFVCDLSFAIKCVESIVNRKINDKLSIAEVQSSIDYISDDRDFQNSYNGASSLLNWNEKLLAWQIINKKYTLIYFTVEIFNVLRKIKAGFVKK